MNRTWLVTIAAVLAVAGCGSSTAPSPGSSAGPSPSITAAPTPTPTPAPTPTAATTPAPTLAPTLAPTPTPAPSVDPSTDLRISAPYTLGELDPVTAASLEAGFKEGLGALSSSVQVGARLVSKGGTAAGIVLDMQLPGAAFASMPSFLESAAQGTAATSGGRITKRTKVRGHRVIVISGGTASFATYQHGEGLVYVVAPTPKKALAMLTSLIKATE